MFSERGYNHGDFVDFPNISTFYVVSVRVSRSK